MSTIGLRWLRLSAVMVAVGFVAGLRLLDGVAIEAFDGICVAIVPMIAGAACLRVAPRQVGAKWAWRLLGLSCMSWGAGNAVWTWLEVVRKVFPFPSLADVGYLAAIPLAAAGMLAFPAAPRQTSSRVRMVLDGVIVTTSLLFCSWALVLGPIYEASSGTLLEQAITLAYPFGDLVIVVIVVLVLTRSAPDQRTPLALIGAGLLAWAVADSGFAVLITKGTYATGNLIDLGWVIGYLLIALAAAQSTARTVATPVTVSTWTEREPLWHMILPYVPIGGVIGVAVGRRLAGHDLQAVLFWIAMILLVALGARQVAALLANRALLAQLRAREVQLAHQALHDPLTGLANRVMFDDRLAHALRQRGHGYLAVLLFDLDDFKTVNDSLGHHAGDALLQAVADRIGRPARAGDTVARIGGDEFALLLEGLTDRADATVVAQRVLDITHAPYAIDGHTVTVTGSVGVAVADVDTAAADVLLRNADIAMYAAKAQGKCRYTVFEPRMRSDTIGQFRLRHDPQTQRSATVPPGLPPR
jgi:diguanylate cyclase (GGDEF)-like protein